MLASTEPRGVVLWLVCVTNQIRIALLFLQHSESVSLSNSLDQSSQQAEKNKPQSLGTKSKISTEVKVRITQVSLMLLACLVIPWGECHVG